MILKKIKLENIKVKAAEELKEKFNLDLTNPENVGQMRNLVEYYKEVNSKLDQVYPDSR